MFHVKHIFFICFFFPLLGLTQHFGKTTIALKALPALPPKNGVVATFLSSFPEYSTLTQEQKEWYYWTNYSRSNPKRFWDSVVSPIVTAFPTLRNSYVESLKEDLYKSDTLPMVKPNTALLEISQSFANEMSSRNASPSHTSPSGATFPDRMKSSGIINCAGENISFGPSNPVLMLVLLYIDEGVQDVGHRRALLNPEYVEMGIGLAKYQNNNTIVIQDFACSQKK